MPKSKITAESTTPTISTDGKAFVYTANNQQNRFVVRGVALASNQTINGTTDLLADVNYDYFSGAVLPGLQALDVNLIRVYQVDLTHQHDQAMAALAAAGIYVMLEVETPDLCVNRVSPSYTSALYERGTAVVDAFQGYTNTFAFSVGNEVVFPGTIYAYYYNQQFGSNSNFPNPPDGQQNTALPLAVADEIACAQVIKSFIRDLKAYMVAQSYRAIPVGIAMQDGPQSSVAIAGLIGTDVVAQYYASGPATDRADFIGINSYRYVNNYNYQTNQDEPGPMSSYDGLATEVSGLPVPVFLTESGGNPSNPPPAAPYCRDWAIVPQMYNEPLLYTHLSGQVAFQFFEAGAYFGLYDQPVAPLTNPPPSLMATTWGGASDLVTQFGDCASLTVPLPPAPPSPTIDPPAACNPALLPPFIAVTVENYATTSAVDVVQANTVLATLPAAANASSPSSASVIVSSGEPLLLQQPGTWDSVCYVAHSDLTAGMVITDQVAWGNNVACPWSPPLGA